MIGPQSKFISGQRLHLQHGPIDLIIQVWGKNRQQAFSQAEARFQNILPCLADELDILRKPCCPRSTPTGQVACRMSEAAKSHTDVFVTPMAAVAGAVADEVCEAMCHRLSLDKAYVNNGGDIAVHLADGHQLTSAIHAGFDVGRVTFSEDQPARGLATSGWRGRSHSLGIADAVTVVADTAANADVAATLIANAIDLPSHPAIQRAAANKLSPDSDLGDMLVTVSVEPLSDLEIETALNAGKKAALKMINNGQIVAATLFLQNKNYTVGGMDFLKVPITTKGGNRCSTSNYARQ